MDRKELRLGGADLSDGPMIDKRAVIFLFILLIGIVTVIGLMIAFSG
jgi:hypothetical protein